MIILYTTSQRWPLGTVNDDPELTVTGPTLKPFLPGVIVYMPVNVVKFSVTAPAAENEAISAG
jgi:hypothetical protein